MLLGVPLLLCTNCQNGVRKDTVGVIICKRFAITWIDPDDPTVIKVRSVHKGSVVEYHSNLAMAYVFTSELADGSSDFPIGGISSAGQAVIFSNAAELDRSKGRVEVFAHINRKLYNRRFGKVVATDSYWNQQAAVCDNGLLIYGMTGMNEYQAVALPEIQGTTTSLSVLLAADEDDVGRIAVVAGVTKGTVWCREIKL